MTLDTLNLLYIILGLCAIVITIPLSMVLWRLYSMMDNVHNIVRFTEKTTNFVSHLDRVPAMLVNSVISRFKR